MATQELTITPHTLELGYCMTSFQNLLDTFAAHMTVDVPVSAVGLIVQEATPDPADQDKVWLKLLSGDPVNFYYFATTGIHAGSWVEVNPPNVFYGVGGNTGNAYTVAIPPAKSPPALVTGQFYFFKVTATNTGPATLQVNAFGAFPFNAAGVALASGQLVTNSYVGAIWTGTTFELFGAGNPSIDVTRITPGSNKQRIETTGGVAGWRGGWNSVTQSTVPTVRAGASNIGNHLLGAVPNLITAWLQVKTGQTDQGYSALDRIELCKALTVDAGSNDKQAYAIVVDLTSVYLIPTIYAGIIVPNKTTGDYTGASDITATIAKWEVVVELFLF